MQELLTDTEFHCDPPKTGAEKYRITAAGSGWFRSIKIRAAATRFVQFYGTVTGPRADSGVVIVVKLQLDVEPMTGIEPAYSAWEVDLVYPAVSPCVRKERLTAETRSSVSKGVR